MSVNTLKIEAIKLQFLKFWENFNKDNFVSVCDYFLTFKAKASKKSL